ncbi:hypothetical protein BDY19DRAFT_227512 [Irpex rosettiformis]|uniref:Uncharacterized protein n=1 Tax=Irpex rosettiformis TaxID=378272 RepID=A0ACB8U0H6_9APHY|nr:hypothetical protein BDY19DRAFT_227512 [Irpex rosettiformis]
MHLNLPRATEDEIGASAPADLAGWLFFQIAAGHIALPILVATFLFAKTVPVHPAVVTVCITWILSGIFSTLLFYVGQHKGPEPSQGLCIAQASLLGATPIMTCSALFLLAYRLWRTWDNGVEDVSYESRRQKYLKLIIYLIPFIVFGLFVAIAADLGLNHTERVNREQHYFYCSLDFSQFSDAVQVIATILCVASIMLQGRSDPFIFLLLINSVYPPADIATKASRFWHAIRERNSLTDEMMSLLIRSAVFTLYLFASTFVNLISIWVPMGALPDMLSASVGMALFCIFISQRSIAEAWRFWKRPRMHDASRTVPIHHVDGSKFTPLPKRRYKAYRDRTSSSLDSSSALSLSGPHALDSFKEFRYDQPPTPGEGVQIIRRPEEAFRSGMAKPDKRDRSSISTWGF